MSVESWIGLLLMVVVAGVLVIAGTPLKFVLHRLIGDRSDRTVRAGSSRIYDRARYHYGSVDGYGLPREHAYTHTTLFLAWAINRSLVSNWFEAKTKRELAAFRAGRLTVNQIYKRWGRRLTSEMLSPEGNAFARSYYHHETGSYFSDYRSCLQGQLPSEYHVQYTADNEALLHKVIDQRFQEWRASQT